MNKGGEPNRSGFDSRQIMQENYKSGFDEEKQRAADRMREMNARSKYAYQNRNRNSKHSEGNEPIPEKLNIPFLGEIGADSDMALILGLVLILSAERSDKLLLLALLYILV